nr:immunoglobulin heavy chain junction region [Mus musculus]
CARHWYYAMDYW